MIHTGLPYDMGEMDAIEEHGAIIDMSRIAFPGFPKEQQARTALIFLSNTNFSKVRLDFSKCSYEQKADLLDEFIETGIRSHQKEFAEAWKEILDYSISGKLPKESIFSDAEHQRFQSEYSEVISELKAVIESVPLYLLHRSLFIGTAQDAFPKRERKAVADNYMELLKLPDIETIMFRAEVKPVYFTDTFTDSNNELFQIIQQHLSFPAVLFGLATESETKWKKETLMHGGRE